MLMTNFQFERLVVMLARCIELDNKSNELKDDGNIVLSINNFLNAMEIDNARAIAIKEYPYIRFELDK